MHIRYHLKINLFLYTLPPSIFRKVRSNTSVELNSRYQSQSQVLTSWTQYDEGVTDLELRSAARMSGGDMELLHILLPHEDRVETAESHSSSLKSWQVFLALNGVKFDTLKRNSKGQVILPLKTIFLALIQFSFRTSKENVVLKYARNVFIFTLIAVPVGIQIYLGCGAFCIAFMILSSIQVYLFLDVNLKFLGAATNDAHRRQTMATALSVFVRADDRITDYEFTTIPKLVSQNIYSATLFSTLFIKTYCFPCHRILPLSLRQFLRGYICV
jgi:hypothetical protein